MINMEVSWRSDPHSLYHFHGTTLPFTISTLYQLPLCLYQFFLGYHMRFLIGAIVNCLQRSYTLFWNRLFRQRSIRNRFAANLEGSFTKMTRFCIAKITSCIKYYYYNNYQYQEGVELECLLESDNESRRQTISVNTGNDRNSRQRRYTKKVFIKILRVSQENTCVGVSF